MPIPNEERDKQFKKDVEAGLSIKDLSKKYGIGLRQISRLKKKLREEKVSIGLTSPATATATPNKRMAFWLPASTIEKIKKLAANQGKTASAILREILKKHL